MALSPQAVTFDWPSVVECAQRKAPELPAAAPQVGQPTDEFIHNYNASQEWGRQSVNIQMCQMALSAWIAGWEAGQAGKPKDPTAN